MNLYKVDYRYPSSEDVVVWEQLKEQEVVFMNGKPTSIRKSLYWEYPQSIRHHLSLFPNNFIDRVDVDRNKDKLLKCITQFSDLLNENSVTERNILSYIKDNEAYFIVGSIAKYYRFGHHAIYVFPEFPLSPNYLVDYLLVGENSDGHHFLFVEFENPYGNITLKDGSFGSTIRKGISQIEQWKLWIEQNFSQLHLVFEKALSKSSILPNEFRYFDQTRFHYAVVAGQRAHFNKRTCRQGRESLEQGKLNILHYNNIIDCSKDMLGIRTSFYQHR